MDQQVQKLWETRLQGTIGLAPLATKPRKVVELGLCDENYPLHLSQRIDSEIFSVGGGQQFTERICASLEIRDSGPHFFFHVLDYRVSVDPWSTYNEIHEATDLIIGRAVVPPWTDEYHCHWDHIARQSLDALREGGILELQVVGNPTLSDQPDLEPPFYRSLENAGFTDITVLPHLFHSAANSLPS